MAEISRTLPLLKIVLKSQNMNLCIKDPHLSGSILNKKRRANAYASSFKL